MLAGGGSGSIPLQAQMLSSLAGPELKTSEWRVLFYSVSQMRLSHTLSVSPSLESLCIHSSCADSDTKVASQLLMGWLCPPQRCWSLNLRHLWMWPYLEIVFVDDQIKMRALRWALIQHVCMLSCFSLVWLCDPMDHSPLGSSAHGILHARILE